MMDRQVGIPLWRFVREVWDEQNQKWQVGDDREILGSQKLCAWTSWRRAHSCIVPRFLSVPSV